MKLDFCAVCGTKDDLHLHHIDPIVHSNVERKSIPKYDNTKQIKDCTPTEIFNALFDRGFISEHATLTLCSYHHNLMHGIVKFERLHQSNLVKEGLERARKNGVKLGRPGKDMSDEMIAKFFKMREDGVSIRKICKEFGIGVGKYYELWDERENEFIKYEEEQKFIKYEKEDESIDKKETKPKLKYSDYFDLPQSVVQ